ncbi:Nucleotidylyl transferase [Lentinula aff. lateritia]|uniref:Nucleotidylyl transferase n=1 Tax=Lentinula aff. lateritia TaxID=2804960 RepID=A0ACC1TRC2_9AGAR|nr:Nucleotidylyl transferase [Lentinula aff. lateritia]
MASSLTTGILVLASLPSLSTPQFLAPIIISAANAASSRLRIVLFSQLFDPGAISHTQSWDNVQKLLTYVYVQATKIAQDKDNPLLQIDVLLKGLNAQEALPENIGEGCEVVYRVSGDAIVAALPPALLELSHRYVAAGSSEGRTTPEASEEVNVPSMLPVVALGGTFDHLHAGHKILLSMAAWITSRKVIVGVTDDTLLKSKSNAHVLESLDTRRTNVRDFLELFKPGLEYDIVTINDVYGPTGWDPDIQGLVVSRETMNGAEMISTHREKEQLPKLSVFITDVISHTSSNITEDDLSLMRQTKMSSTHIRNWIAMHEKQHYQPQNQQVDGESKPVERGQVGWISSQDA